MGNSTTSFNIFDLLPEYAGKWNLTESRAFTQEEIDTVIKAIVVPSQWGNSVEFWKTNGSKVYIPLSTDSALSVGDTFDLITGKFLTLSKTGEKDIHRVLEG